jgi:hypothetical protein
LVAFHNSPHSCFLSLRCVPTPPAMESRRVAERPPPQRKGNAMEISSAVLRGVIARAAVIVYLTVFLVLLMKIAAPMNVVIIRDVVAVVAAAWCLEGDQCGICRFWANNYFACLVKKTGMVVNGE